MYTHDSEPKTKKLTVLAPEHTSIISHIFHNLYNDYVKENQPWESYLMAIGRTTELLHTLYYRKAIAQYITTTYKSSIRRYQDKYEIETEWRRLSRMTLRRVSDKKLKKVFVPSFWRIAQKIEKGATLQHSFGRVSYSPSTWTLLRDNGAYYLEGRVAGRKVCEAYWNNDERTVVICDNKLFPLWVAAINDTKNYKGKRYTKETW